MKRIISLLLIIPVILFAQDPVTVNPDQPQYNSRLTVTYDPLAEEAAIRNAVSLSLYAIHWIEGDEAIFREYPMSMVRDRWETELDPASIGPTRYMTFKFTDGTIDDDRDGSFWELLFYSADGKPEAASLYHRGRSYLHPRESVSRYSGAEMLREYDQQQAEKIFADAYRFYPRHPDIARMYMLGLAGSFRDQEDSDAAKKLVLDIASELESLAPDDLSVLAAIAHVHGFLGDTEKMNGYRARVLEADPLHRESRSFRFRMGIDRSTEVGERIRLLRDFLNDFPEDGNSVSLAEQLTDILVREKRLEEALGFIRTYPYRNPAMYNIVVLGLQTGGKTPEEIITVVLEMQKLLNEPPRLPRPATATDREWARLTESDSFIETHIWLKSRALISHALALSSLEKHDAAIEKIRTAHELNNGEHALVNAQYMKVLGNADRYGEALEIGRLAVVANKTTDDLITDLRELYVEIHGSDLHFIEYLKEAEAESYRYLWEKFSGAMKHKPAPGFTLERLNGEPVSLADLRGKVVIVDFWATWCGPCVSAFPYFQKVVDHFRDTDDVVFLAVNTWDGEMGEDRTGRVNRFMDKNNYTFQVLFDEDTSVREFGVRGIPTRFAIGRDGYIKFEDSGFSGPGMFNDMVVQIDVLLAEDGPWSNR